MRLAKEVLKIDEGWRPKPYYCTEGYPTIGYGFKIGNKGDPLPDITMSRSEGVRRLDDKIFHLSEQFDSIEQLGEVRHAVIICMAYQLGASGVREFKKMWAAIDREDWISAHDEMLDSLWSKQTPSRAKRYAMAMKTGSEKWLLNGYS